MSWGQGAAEGSSSAATAVEGASSSASPTPSGFSLDTAVQSNNIPLNTASSSPSFMDTAVNYLDRFNKGGEQKMGEAWKGAGNNPETYGYLANKLSSFTKGGGQSPAAPITINNSTAPPQNSYLSRRGRY